MKKTWIFVLTIMMLSPVWAASNDPVLDVPASAAACRTNAPVQGPLCREYWRILHHLENPQLAQREYNLGTNEDILAVLPTYLTQLTTDVSLTLLHPRDKLKIQRRFEFLRVKILWNQFLTHTLEMFGELLPCRMLGV